MYTCYGCEKSLKDIQEVSVGMNLPDVTPGPVYFCHECRPVPDTAEELIESMDSFINPPKEKGV